MWSKLLVFAALAVAIVWIARQWLGLSSSFAEALALSRPGRARDAETLVPCRICGQYKSKEALCYCVCNPTP